MRDFADDYLEFRFYRFVDTTQEGPCLLNGLDIELTGVNLHQNDEESKTCETKLSLDGLVFNETSAEEFFTYNGEEITYKMDETPVLDSIEPRYGSVLGGNTVTFSITLPEEKTYEITADDITVMIDGSVCTMKDTTVNTLTVVVLCETTKKENLFVEPSLEININATGLGNVATQGKLFRYVSLWS